MAREESGKQQQIDHTYAFLKTGEGNRYLKYAEKWGGFYIGFKNFPLDLLAGTYQEAATIYPAIRNEPERSYFKPLQEIYRASLPRWREKVRFAIWNRLTSCLEIWQPTDQLRPFPRAFVPNLFDDCATEADLSTSTEWHAYLKAIGPFIKGFNPDALSDNCEFATGPSGCRFLPAKRICDPIPSETLYAPIDTLSVLQQLNRRTFAYMTTINPPSVPWPEGIFDGSCIFGGPEGSREESGYGRFVREYLDRIVNPTCKNTLSSLTYEQRMLLVCATVNPLLVETAAMLFAIDIGMVIDSGRGKGRQGIDVVAACDKRSTPADVIQKLHALGISLPAEAVDHLRATRTLSFQCKGYHGFAATSASRLVEFRPFQADAAKRGVSLLEILRLARDPERTGFRHLNAWLDRMCDAIVPGTLVDVRRSSH
jgi:hypothetical protein